MDVTVVIDEDAELVDPVEVVELLEAELRLEHGARFQIRAVGLRRRKTPGGRPLLLIHGEGATLNPSSQ